MRRIFRNLALLAVAAMGVISCQKSELEQDNNPYDVAGTVLCITTPAVDSQTKVEFTESASSTVAIVLNWELNDELTIYNESGNRVDNFKCIDITTCEFSPVGGTELTDGKYTAIYPASTESTLSEAQSAILASVKEQDGDAISNLDDACYMLSEFDYSVDGDQNVQLEHQMSIVTFTFTSSVRPAKLVFENGEDVYTVTYSEIEPVNGYYTSHIMVEPCEATSRELVFSLYATSESVDAYDVRKVTSEVACLAGNRYTAPVSDLDPTLWLGSGTELDPYQMSSAEQLQELATIVNTTEETFADQYFIMTKNIDLSTVCSEALGSWTPIGDYSSETAVFAGQFDGQEFEVSGLYIGSDYQGEMFVALFGCFYSQTGAIKNLSVSGSVTASAMGVAGVVGMSVGAITNCSNSCTVVNNHSEGDEVFAGGVVAMSMGVITNCSNSGTISSAGAAAGVVAFVVNSVVNCSNSGSVTSLSNDEDLVAGGVVGTVEIDEGGFESIISGCSNSGTVTGNVAGGVIAGGRDLDLLYYCSNSGTVNGSYNAGGVVGYSDIGIIDKCYSISSSSVVGGSSSATGGVAGELSNSSAIINSYNEGSVKNGAQVGGLVGESGGGSVINCYNKGVVSGDSSVGGAVGDNSGLILNFYNTGSITATSSYGGVVGSSSIDVTNCYTIAVSGGSEYGTEKSIVEMQGSSYTFLDDLNSTASYYNGVNANSTLASQWVRLSTGSTPTLDFDNDAAASTFAVSFSGGDGSELDPYSISDADDLVELYGLLAYGFSTEGLYFELTDNIDLSTVCGSDLNEGTSWTPIGGTGVAFNGYFEGNGKKIEGLYINSSDDYQALFGSLGSSGTIANLTVLGSVTGGSNVAGVVAKSLGTIYNCHNQCSVSGGGSIGGIVGNNRGTIENCSNTASISGGKNSVGGIAGYNDQRIIYCFNTARVYTEGSYVGGVVGECSENCSVDYSYNSGDIGGENYAGGVVGYTYPYLIGNCYSVTSNIYVSSSSSYVGGVIGGCSSFYAQFNNCYWDNDLYSGAGIGTEYITLGGVTGCTTEQMKGVDVLEYLNSGASYGGTEDFDPTDPTSGNAWVSDSEPYINSGYPILIWQQVE